MEKKYDDQRWLLTNSTEDTVELQETGGEDETEDDETLSLSDLPLIIHKKEEKTNRAPTEKQAQPDFYFCSLSKESEMRAADEIFFQGQILPMRHSVSSDKVSLLQYRKTPSICRSESMDHLFSGSNGLISSRSSSIGSYQSSSSSGSSSGPKLLPPRNQFHSHPSPSPRIHLPSKKHMISSNSSNNRPNKSSAWNVFRLGILTTPPEIAFQDLKPRLRSNNSSNCRNFGSRNSTGSNSSSINASKKKKNKTFFGGCKCSIDAVDAVRSRVVVIKRSASGSTLEALQLEQENAEAMKPDKKRQAAKKRNLSHHRTFEWLKQLSLQDAAAEA